MIPSPHPRKLRQSKGRRDQGVDLEQVGEENCSDLQKDHNNFKLTYRYFFSIARIVYANYLKNYSTLTQIIQVKIAHTYEIDCRA